MALRVESCNIWTKEINDGTDAINRGNNLATALVYIL